LNVVPEDAIWMDVAKMEAFVTQTGLKLGMPQQDATLFAHLLTLNDLRGVFSHGSKMLPNYVHRYRRETLNPQPNVAIVAETETTLIVDGDGGLGFFPAHRAAQALIEKCLAHGVAAALTRNHGHIGAAGLYARLPVEHDLVCFGTSGHRLNLAPAGSVLLSGGASPITFAVPAGDEPPLVLDFGATNDLDRSSEAFSRIFELAPGMVFRALGLGAICQALGGVLAGQATCENFDRHSSVAPSNGTYPAANQGALFVAFDVSRFVPIDQFKRDMDDYIRRARAMQPLPGQSWAGLAGGLEWQRQRDWSRSGIPVGKEHRKVLEWVARELDIPPLC
jgi:L-2-hydroxycarboxylate dehydrogenase (NAD+)